MGNHQWFVPTLSDEPSSNEDDGEDPFHLIHFVPVRVVETITPDPHPE